MFIVTFKYLDDVYQDGLRDKHRLKHLNYYFADNNWKIDALVYRVLELQNLDLHGIMKDFKTIPVKGIHSHYCI